MQKVICPLYLASQSSSRRELLELSKIPFTVINQDADEMACDLVNGLEAAVMDIALSKMNHAQVPAGTAEGDICLVLTSDTLVEDADGALCGKPVDRDDAVAMLRNARRGSRVATAFCLDKKIWRNGTWEILDRITQVVGARYCINIPDDFLEKYFDQIVVYNCAGACFIEGFGMQFVEYIDGSYSAIVGLPVFEVRAALHKMGFFE